jgi:hypothetical protein
MAESTLSMKYSEIRSRLAHFLGWGRHWKEGTCTVASGVVTIAGTTLYVPSWAAAGQFINPANGNRYPVNTRNNNTQFTLVDTSITVSSGSAYTLCPWSDDEFDDLISYIDSGLAQFYSPQVLDGERKSHEWGFLHPEVEFIIWNTQAIDYTTPITVTYASYDSANNETTVTASAGTRFYPSMVGATLQAYNSASSSAAATNTYTIKTYTSATVIEVTGNASGETDATVYSIEATGDYRLPDNHGGIWNNKIAFDKDDNSYNGIQMTGVGEILQLRQQNIGSIVPTSRAVYAAEKAETSDGTDGQKNTLMIWPLPNGIRTLHYQANQLQDALTEDTYPLGGQAHGETILASCLSVAESREDDYMGPMMANFMRLLRTSVSRDREQYNAKFLGYNADYSDGHDSGRRRSYQTVTYDGVTYSGS